MTSNVVSYIVEKKEKEKKEAKEIRNKLIAIVVLCVLDNLGWFATYFKLQKVCKNKKMLSTAKYLFNLLKRHKKDKRSLFAFINNYDFAFSLFNKTINSLVRENEKKRKDLYVDLLLKENRKQITSASDTMLNSLEEKNSLDPFSFVAKYREKKAIRPNNNAKIFYLCSYHADCAEDHLDAQGKIYIDDRWESLITNKELKSQINTYIFYHNTKSVKYIVGAPVFLLTRPNCRHYFKALSTNEVLLNSEGNLLAKYKMISKEGSRSPLIQTKDFDGRKKEAIEFYSDRLAYHEYLKKKLNLKEIDFFITKDRILLSRWKKL